MIKLAMIHKRDATVSIIDHRDLGTFIGAKKCEDYNLAVFSPDNFVVHVQLVHQKPFNILEQVAAVAAKLEEMYWANENGANHALKKS